MPGSIWLAAIIGLYFGGKDLATKITSSYCGGGQVFNLLGIRLHGAQTLPTRMSAIQSRFGIGTLRAPRMSALRILLAACEQFRLLQCREMRRRNRTARRVSECAAPRRFLSPPCYQIPGTNSGAKRTHSSFALDSGLCPSFFGCLVVLLSRGPVVRPLLASRFSDELG